MKDSEIEPLSAQLQTLVEAERAAPGPPGGVKARVGQRVHASISGLGGASGAGGAVGAGGASVVGAGGLKLAPAVIAAFVVGAGAGVFVHRSVVGADRREPERIGKPTDSTVPPAPAAAPTASPAAVPSQPTLPVPPTVEKLPKATPRVSGPSRSRVTEPAESRDTLPAERALMASARKALADGDVARAIGALEQHAREHGEGLLVQERESLWILCLVQSGQYEPAKARAVRFRQRFPGSLFQPSVDQALDSKR